MLNAPTQEPTAMLNAPTNETTRAAREEVPHIEARWCEQCQAWKNIAILKRVGDRASTVDYIPLCVNCGGVLMSSKPRPEF